MSIKLPISKSIANRILLLQAIHGDPLMRVSSDMPDDVIVLHDALEALRKHKKGEPLTLYLKNCGTALRFLQVHLDKCYPGEPITLTGDPRLKERDGKPTSQTTSALIMHGEDIPYSPDESPYFTMTRKVMESFSEQRERSFSETVFQRSGLSGEAGLLEADWSAAAFWYEYIAIHGGELFLEGLKDDSIQGDRIVADIYAQHFGMQATFMSEGVFISRRVQPVNHEVILDFTRIPDLYPAIALTCERLGIDLKAIGTERLQHKESDRLEAVRLHEVRNDHRIAMALIAADYIDWHSLAHEKRNELQTIIAKSYPQFAKQIESISSQTRKRHVNDTLTTRKRDVNDSGFDCSHVIPKKGINDDGLGKKHALSKLIHASNSEYIWLHDDDVIWPSIIQQSDLSAQQSFNAVLQQSDLWILPLRMECQNPNLLEQLQIAEYAAIQELTMRMAKKGRAVMCSGANLIVRREAWLACESELHPDIPSGDDMFLLEAAKRHGFKIGVIDEPDYTAIVRPQNTWRAFFQQRMRWAGKAPHYTDKDIRRCGALVLMANMLQILCPPIILIKFPIEYSLIKKREPQTLWPVALLLEILYPFYLLISLLGGLFRKEW